MIPGIKCDFHRVVTLYSGLTTASIGLYALVVSYCIDTESDKLPAAAISGWRGARGVKQLIECGWLIPFTDEETDRPWYTVVGPVGPEGTDPISHAERRRRASKSVDELRKQRRVKPGGDS